MKYICGIDIGGTTVKIGIFKDSKIIDNWVVKTDKSNNGENILKDIYKSIVSKYPNLNDFLGFGFGVPGPVVNGVVNKCVNLGWGKKDVEYEFSKLVGQDSTVIVDNDANVATAGELWQGVARGYQNVVMFTLGTGIGGGVINHGKIIQGENGSAGEVGHIIVVKDESGIKCKCGRTGCIETIASATGIVNQYRKYVKDNSISNPLKDPELSCKAIFDNAKKGDKSCLAVLNSVMDYLGYALSIVALTTNPKVFIIGGAVANAGTFLTDMLKEHYQKYSFHSTVNTKIVVAELGGEAGMYGAAYLVKTHE